MRTQLFDDGKGRYGRWFGRHRLAHLISNEILGVDTQVRRSSVHSGACLNVVVFEKAIRATHNAGSLHAFADFIATVMLP